jgi:methionine aminopeptidase
VVADAIRAMRRDTADGAMSAHAEHTIVVTAGEPLVLTR